MRKQIALACEWSDIVETIAGNLIGTHKNALGEPARDYVPDYPACLNACHEMEKLKSLDESDRHKPATERFNFKFHEKLHEILQRDRASGKHWSTLPVHATAAQRAEAFCRTLNLTTPRQ